MALAVNAGRVEKRIADFQGAPERTLRFIGIGFTVTLGHAHAAQADGGDFKRTQFSFFHLYSALLPCLCLSLSIMGYRAVTPGKIKKATRTVLVPAPAAIVTAAPFRA